MKQRLMFLVLLVPLASRMPMTAAAEKVEWTGDPIHIYAVVDKERRLIIGEVGDELEIRIGLPNRASEKLIAQSIGNNVWLTSLDSLDAVRMLLQIYPSNVTVVAEVTAVADPSPIQLAKASENLQIILPTDISGDDVKLPTIRISSPGFAAMTRFAVRELYSPPRLRTSLPGANRYPPPEQMPHLFRCGSVNRPAPCGDAMSVQPIAAWRTEMHFITAILLTNTLEQPLVLDPRDLRGTWRTATFIGSRLMPSGQPDASTVLVLISDVPAAEALSK